MEDKLLKKEQVKVYHRMKNHVIDNLLLLFVFAIVANLFKDIVFDLCGEVMANVLVIIWLLGLNFFYYYYFEYKTGKTFGKYLTGTRAVSIEDQKLNKKQAFLRTITRVIPFDNLSYLFANRGFHDYISRTKLIYD